MPNFSQEDTDRILARIRERAPTVRSCPLCGTMNGYTLVPTLVKLMLSEPHTPQIVVGNQAMPFAVLICNQCGNTLFVNLFTIGLGDISGLTQDAPEPPAGTEDPRASENEAVQ